MKWLWIAGAMALAGCNERVPPESAEEAAALNQAAEMLDVPADDAALPPENEVVENVE